MDAGFPFRLPATCRNLGFAKRQSCHHCGLRTWQVTNGIGLGAKRGDENQSASAAHFTDCGFKPNGARGRKVWHRSETVK
jgi:hypothetical protein